MMLNQAQRSARVAGMALRRAAGNGSARAFSSASSSMSTDNAGEFIQTKKVEGKDRLILFGEWACLPYVSAIEGGIQTLQWIGLTVVHLDGEPKNLRLIVHSSTQTHLWN
jgi:hypothetical protein